MFGTQSITDRYRSLTNDMDDVDFTREIGVVSSLSFAAWGSILYLWVFFGGGAEFYTPGLTPPSFEGVVFFMPFPSILAGLAFYAVLRLGAPRLPGRSPLNALAAIWALLAPIPLAVTFAVGVYKTSLERGLEAIQEPGALFFVLFVCLAATVLTTFAGIAYAASTGLFSLSGRGRRRAIVAVLVVVALPLGIGLAASAGDKATTDNTYNMSDYDDGDAYTGGFDTAPEKGQIAPGDFGENNGPLACSGEPPAKDAFRNQTAYEPGTINVSDSWLTIAQLQHVEYTTDGRTVHGEFPAYYTLHFDVNYRHTAMENWESNGVAAVTPMSDTHAASFNPHSGPNTPEVQMEQVDSMLVYQDFVTQDGEVVRYGTRLCRPDGEGA